MSVLSSRGLYQSVMKDQQQKTCDKETVDNSRHEIQLSKPTADTGQPHAGQRSDATWVTKQLVSKVDTPSNRRRFVLATATPMQGRSKL